MRIFKAFFILLLVAAAYAEDAAEEEAAPVEAVPVEAVPVEAAAVEAAPVEAAAEEAAAVEAAPVEATAEVEAPPAAVEEPEAVEPVPEVAAEEVPAATEEVPVATEEVPAATEEVPAATEEVPAATEEVPAATEEVPAATEEEPAAVCIVSDIAVQSSFDVKAFMGAWHVTKDTGLFPFQRTLDLLFYSVQDHKHFFELQEDGNIKQITSTKSFFGCSVEVGVLQHDADALTPAKMTSSYPASWVPALKNPSPVWVIATDYTSWALAYSCRKVSVDGTCHPKHTIAWTMQRNPQEELSLEVLGQIHQAVDDQLCLEFDTDFKVMPRGRVCPDIDPADYPDAVVPKTEL